MSGAGGDRAVAGWDVCIIGGGAAGLMAAAHLAAGGARTLLLEQSDRVGRKLLATGNGRCNLLNMRLGDERYFSHDPERALAVLRRWPPERLLEEFGRMGVVTCEEDDGRVYPLSGQAASVLDALRLSVSERGATTECAAAAVEAAPLRAGWRVRLADGREVNARRVVLACGGRAQPTPPADRQAKALDALRLLGALGHRVHEPQPALTALRCDMSALRGLKGVRVRCALTLEEARSRRALRREEGEALFTDYGVSGIAAMQLSRALISGARCVLALDLLPDMSGAQARALLARRASELGARPCESFFAGMLNRLLAQCVLRRAGVDARLACGELTGSELDALAQALKHLSVDVLGAQDFKSAQVMRGGAALCDFDEALMSRRAPGLYACGELMDVDGECGGYNLMWAWASALTVAEGILADMRGAGKEKGR